MYKRKDKNWKKYASYAETYSARVAPMVYDIDLEELLRIFKLILDYSVLQTFFNFSSKLLL